MSAAKLEHIASAKPTVLIVEDQKVCRERVHRALSSWKGRSTASPTIKTAEYASLAREHLDRDDIDLFILDLEISERPNMGAGEAVGRKLLQEIHAKSNAGIIVYATQHLESDEDILLSEGADDYVTKIAGTDDQENINKADERLRSRVEAVWRRILLARPNTSSVFAHTNRKFLLGKWCFTVGDRLLRDEDGNTVKLSQTQHAVLRHACIADDHKVDLDTFNLVLGRSDPFDRVTRIDSFVARMRNKLGEENLQLVPVRGSGYRLVGSKEIRGKAS